MKKLVAFSLAIIIFTSNIHIVYANDEVNEIIPVYKIQNEINTAKQISPTEKELPVKSAILIEQSTGNVLFEQNADEILPPASVTKIMSLLLIIEAIDSGKISLTDKVTCSENAASYGGSQIWLKPNETMTVDELLKATAVSSANDATVCLAEYVSGSEEAFIKEMNKRASELGMKNTTFKCVEGLDTEGHLTTARDIALMSRELMKHSLIKKYTTIWMDSLRNGETQLVNTNRLIRFYDGATGLKTGTTSKAGSCLSATAERDGLSLIAVIMGAPTSDLRFGTARGLLDWGFANYTSITVTPPNFDTIPVKGGTKEFCSIEAILPNGIVVKKDEAEMISQLYELPEVLEAPILKGDEISKLKILINNNEYTECPIIASESVAKITFRFALQTLFGELFKLS